MSNQPWDFDYELTMPNVIALARACALHGEVTPLGAGFDHANFRCDDQVLRIPKRVARAKLLQSELALLHAMPADLPLRVPRPRRELVSVAALPYPSMVYPYIVGTPLDQRDPSGLRRAIDATQAARIGEQIGSFLCALHAMPIPSGQTHVVHDHMEWLAYADRNLDVLRPVLGSALTDRLSMRLLEPLPACEHALRLCHHDLGAEHILVNDVGDAVAVIDWGDCDIAPWWGDFVGLWMWGGDAALHAALARYGRALSADETLHLRQRALLAAIGECHYAVQQDPADWHEKAAVYISRML